MFGRWIGVSYRVVSDICYWILSKKEKVLSRIIVQHLTAEEPRDTDVQEIGSVIIMALWKMHLEARTLVLVWMYMTPSLMMTKRVFIMTPTRRDIKDLQIPLIKMK